MPQPDGAEFLPSTRSQNKPFCCFPGGLDRGGASFGLRGPKLAFAVPALSGPRRHAVGSKAKLPEGGEGDSGETSQLHRGLVLIPPRTLTL